MANQSSDAQVDARTVKKIGYLAFDSLINTLAVKIDRSLFDGVYGIPRGGAPVAIALASKLKLSVLDEPSENTLICDDICDSGRTLSRFQNHKKAVLFTRKKTKQLVNFYSQVSPDWIQFPWEESEAPAEDAVIRLLQYIGEDVDREGLKDTPKRVIKSYRELFAGYKMNPEQVLGTTFDSAGYDQIVILKDIEMYSTCEHHMIPFVGSVSIGYIPSKRVVGLSKLARLVEVFSRRLQIQEKLTEEIADTLMRVLEPQGAMVIIKAKHFCMCARGVNKQNSSMLTSAIRGRFQDAAVRSEFLSLIGTP